MLGLGLGLPGAAVMRGGGGAKTYADFQAHIATLATGGVRTWAQSPSGSAGSVTTVASPTATGTMEGSSWGPSSAQGYRPVAGTSMCRLVQHGLESEAVFNDQCTAGRTLLVEVSSASGFSAPPAVNRNGYQSLAATADGPTQKILTILAWIGPDVGGYAIKMQPSLGLGPTPYTIP